MGDEARADVIAAVRTVCGIVRTTLGPFGANKLMVEQNGTVSTTSSGAAVLDRLEIKHAAVTLLKSAASDFHDEHGDGTTTLVALVGALLQEAERLSEMGIHPTTIERGYREAMEVTQVHIDDHARPLSLVGADAVARTALTGTRNPATRQHMGTYLEQVADVISTEWDSIEEFDPKRVKVIARIGAAASESELIEGVIVDRKPVNESMPRTIPNAGIALFSSTVDVPKFGTATNRKEMEMTFRPETFEDRAAIGDREREEFQALVDRAVEAGCRFIATERSINDRVKAALSSNGMLAIQRVDEEDLARIARTTGAQIVPDLGHVTADTLGTGDVTVKREAGRDFVFVEATGGDPVYTLFCRAPDPRSVDTFQQSVENALAATLLARWTERIVPGGGAIEMSCARAVRDHAHSVGGREQLVVEAFADALPVVPRTLATNAGMDGGRTLVRLHTAHHDGRDTMGVDSIVGTIADVLDDDDPIVEPALLKREIYSTATELAIKLIRIDEQLEATELNPDDDGIPGPGEEGAPVPERE